MVNRHFSRYLDRCREFFHNLVLLLAYIYHYQESPIELVYKKLQQVKVESCFTKYLSLDVDVMQVDSWLVRKISKYLLLTDIWNSIHKVTRLGPEPHHFFLLKTSQQIQSQVMSNILAKMSSGWQADWVTSNFCYRHPMNKCWKCQEVIFILWCS